MKLMKQNITNALIATSAMLMPLFVPSAASAAPADKASAKQLTPAKDVAADECTKELLLSNFPEPIVQDTLKRFNIPQDKWAGITIALSDKDKEIVKIVEKKAAAMTPNPLKDPQQRQAAVKLFRDTLMAVFSDAMKDNGVTDTSKFQAMIDDIQQQKAKKFAMCMEKKKASTKTSFNDEPTGKSRAAIAADEVEEEIEKGTTDDDVKETKKQIDEDFDFADHDKPASKKGAAKS